MSQPATSEDIGKIGIPHLKRLWSRAQSVRTTGLADQTTDGEADTIVIHGLGLNLLETYRYLYGFADGRTPDFAEFEQWVLDKNSGSISPDRISRIKASLAGEIGEPAPTTTLARVFSDDEMKFWDEHGYVILHNAVTEEQRQAAVEVLCDHLKVNLDDPETWYTTGLGASIMVELVHHPALNATRESPRIRQAFAQIWGTADLFMTNDRCGFNPPERPGFRFPGPYLHWDTSLVAPVPLGTQGILYLTDTEAEQGALTCVPGFNRRIDTWLTSLPADVNPRLQNFSSESVPIAGRAGDLIIWHHALPHGSRPNRTTRPRLVQYINMYPPNLDDKRPWV